MRLQRLNPVGIVGRVVVLFAVLAVTLCAAGPALALPEGRVYEKVTPAFKGGYGAAGIVGVESGGEAVAYDSAGVFAGEPADKGFVDYEAVRSASGWSTLPLMPAAGFAPHGVLRGFSSSLGASLWELDPGAPNNLTATNELQLAGHAPGTADTEAGFQPIGSVLKAISERPLVGNLNINGFSGDLCHVVVESFGDQPLLAEAVGMEAQLYDVSAGCHGEPSYLRLVALNSSGGSIAGTCKPALGEGGGESQFNAVSENGDEIFFTDAASECRAPRQLFVRVGGVRTLEVSKPLVDCQGGEVPCGGAAGAPAHFWGASEDGSRVFFTTAAPLDQASDLDSGSDLYMARIGCPGEASGCGAAQRVVTGLVQVSHDPHAGQAAEVQGVVGLAPDGSHAYFVARGVLSGTVGPQGLAAVDGADNLYMYDSVTGQVGFVGDLCSGPEESGAVADAACPNDLDDLDGEVARNDTQLWLGFPHAPAQTAGLDGGFLVFSTYARLITSGPEADADDAQDVYRYDAQTGTLMRVSIGEGGYDANGNRNDGEQIVGKIGNAPVRAGDAWIESDVTAEIGGEERGGVRRAISDDGSRIVFMSVEPLSANATNGQVDVYEWHNGSVSLVSCGCSTEPDREPVLTPSGRDLFFKTTAGLVVGDSDGAPDLYDARLGGGFTPPQAPPERCEGDACQGPLTNPAPLLVPGSAVQAAGENAPAPQTTAPSLKTKKQATKKKTTTKKQVRKRGCEKRRSCVKKANRRVAAARRAHRARRAVVGESGRGGR